ncbi:SAM-dependent methyltransferase [Frankia gtarii]|uniref:SAM-dependent methyltransferase n=1 Tax=Frankia gtarii TaxID=2950102 RepID=UPI0021C00D15|nr:SAM-dependent methyltransferase [Frankia gtarii]
MPSKDSANGAVAATVTASDIARLASVGRAAVSNWRHRFADFPRPVGGTSSHPLFALTEVEHWFARHDRPFQLEPADRVWQRIRGAVDDPRLGELVGRLGAFLVYHQRDPAGAVRLLGSGEDASVAASVAASVEAAIGQAVPELPNVAGAPSPWDPGWVPIARVAAQAVGRHGHADLFDALRARFHEVHSRRAAALPAAVAELMVTLAGLRGPAAARARVLDPACGIGRSLAAARAAGVGELLGQDVDPTVARVSAAGLLLRGGQARIVVGDSLRADAFAGERVDAVLCRPPFGQRTWGYDELLGSPWWRYGLPPRGEPELAWVQYCLAHASVGAPVLVVMPVTAASRRAGRRIRANLLRARALRAVVGLPPALFPVGSAPDLWILHQPEERASAVDVLLGSADGDLGAVEAAWRSFTADRVDAADRDPELPAGFRRMPVADLLDEEVDLSPRRHVRLAPAPSTGASFPAAREGLLAAVTALAGAIPDLAAVGRPAQDSAPDGGMAGAADLPLGELARAGAVHIVVASASASASVQVQVQTDGELRLLTADDVRLTRSSSGRAGPRADQVLLQSGDVVGVATSAGIIARVIEAEDVGAVLGPRLVLLRVDPDRLDPFFLAGSLRAAGGYRTGSGAGVGAGAGAQPAGVTGGSSARTELRRLRVPVLPMAAQRTRGADYRRLAATERSLRGVLDFGAEVVRLGYLGVADGSLRGGDAGSR